MRIEGDASLTVTVNIPNDQFEIHAKRVIKLLEQGGYEAYPMTGDFIIRLANQIQAEMAQHNEATRLIQRAADSNPERENQNGH